MTTGQLIQQARKSAGLSQKQLGEKLDLSASMIGQWENDLRNPKPDTLKRIAAALDIDWLSLLPKPKETNEDEAAAIAQEIVREIGLPTRGNTDATVGEMRILMQRVSEIYGDESAYLIRLVSVMDDEGVGMVIEYTESIFNEHIFSPPDKPTTAPESTPPSAEGNGYHPGPRRARNAARGGIEGGW